MDKEQLTTKLRIRIQPSLRNKLIDYAEQTDQSLSAVIRELIYKGLVGDQQEAGTNESAC